MRFQGVPTGLIFSLQSHLISLSKREKKGKMSINMGDYLINYLYPLQFSLSLFLQSFVGEIFILCYPSRRSTNIRGKWNELATHRPIVR